MAGPSEIEKLERRYSENPDGRFFAPLADAYRKAGSVDRALELVRAGLAKHPDYLSAYIVLGRCLLDKNADGDAAATFERVLGLDAENIIALKSLAEISERAGRPLEARAWLQKLLVVDSMNAEAEADLQRLGGAIEAGTPGAAAPAAEAAPSTGISFADVASAIEGAPPAPASVPAAEPPQAQAPAAEAAPAPAAPAAEPAPARVELLAPPQPAPALATPVGLPTLPPTPAVEAPAPAAESAPAPAAESAPTPAAESAPTPVVAEAMPAPVAPPATAVPLHDEEFVLPASGPSRTPPSEALPPVYSGPAPEGPGGAGEPVEPAGLELEPEPAAMEEPEPLPDRHPLPDELQVADSSLELMPFDDSLAWGTGERSSRAIRAEDVAAVEHDQQLTSPAVEFISGLPGAAAGSPEPQAEPGALEFMIEPPPDQSFGAVAPELPSNVELPSNLSGTYSLVDESEYAPGTVAPAPVPAAAAPAPPAEAAPPPAAAAAAGSADLPLIMPEDVTPPEEMARPSTKLLQMLSPAPTAPAEEKPMPEPMLTETLGDLYLKQGFRAEAAGVFRRLLDQRPGDAALTAKLRAVEAPAAPDLSATALGSESVGAWLRRVAGARIAAVSTAAPAAPPPPQGPSPLEAAFTSPGGPDGVGEPAHPAPDAFSLDQIFGAGPESGPPAKGPAGTGDAAPQVAPPGTSFDDFFGAAPDSLTVRPSTGAPQPPAPGGGEEDLSAFNAWLQGLKR